MALGSNATSPTNKIIMGNKQTKLRTRVAKIGRDIKITEIGAAGVAKQDMRHRLVLIAIIVAHITGFGDARIEDDVGYVDWHALCWGSMSRNSGQNRSRGVTRNESRDRGKTGGSGGSSRSEKRSGRGSGSGDSSAVAASAGMTKAGV